jgi:hypothetical protein
METFESIAYTVEEGDWFLSFDLVKGFFNIPVHKSHRKYFVFEFKGTYYQFVGLAMGSSASPRIFTLVIKALLKVCRIAGILIYAFFDDTLSRSKSFELAEVACHFVMDLFQRAGFLIHPEKSVLSPTQEILFLGFILNSRSMEIALPREKEQRLRREVRWWLHTIHSSSQVILRKAAAFLGFLISVLPASVYGKGHFRRFQREVDFLLNVTGRNYNAYVLISPFVLADLHWWANLPSPVKRPIHLKYNRVYVTTDASSSGWGIVWESETRAGTWPLSETRHINVLELQVILFIFSAFDHPFSHVHLVVSMDNLVAASYVNKLGGKKHDLGLIGEQIANVLESRSSIISAVYVPSHLNEADAPSRGIVPSRLSMIDSEWALDPDVFENLRVEFQFNPSIDWFASSSNSKCDQFVSLYYEPQSMAIDALLLPWTDEVNYLFPPFILITRVIQKLKAENLQAVLIHPIWPSSTWWPLLLPITIRTIDLPPIKHCLHLPNHPRTRHRLRHLNLRATFCSGA